jgi:cysteinyl-tRNA synthetase
MEEFVSKISDDLAMPEALAVVWKLVRSEIAPGEKWTTLREMDKMLGLRLGEKIAEEEIPEEILKLVDQRQRARETKDWLKSDRLRDIIKSKGYIVEDLPNSCKIRKL